MNVLSDIGRMASAMAESVSAFVNANKSLSYGAGGAVLMAVLAGMLWPGDQDVTGPDMADVSLSGSWKVSYTDRVLGAVEGSALVSEDESSVTVRLVHPTTEARMTLQSNVVSRAGNTLNITLRGDGPSVQNLVDSAVGQYLDVGEGTPYQSQGPDQIILSMGEASMRVTVREPAQASVQEIKLELTIGREALTGNWTQIVNPETGRDQNNRGRIGELAYLDDGTGRARQSGRESWRRPKPIIHMAVVHADQYAQSLTGSAAYPYPWNDDGTAAAAPYSQRRHILVLGEDLPTELGETATFTSTNPNVEYFLSLKPSNLRFFPASGYMIDRAWARIENNLRQQMLAVSPNGVISPAGEAAIAQTLNELHELDFVLVRAQLAEGAVPGKTEFTLNGTTANWSLGYGDYNGSFAFARPLPAGPDEAGISEPLDYAFIPDKVFLEIRTNKQMPFDNVPMQIWLPGEGGKLQPRLFNGKRELTAVRLPITETDR
jgi:hypothetical protein